MEDKVKLPAIKECPPYLNQLLDYKGGPKLAKFRGHIRAYNSMSAFTLIRAKVDKEINKEPGPYIFRISGAIYYRMLLNTSAK